jgi:DNA-binding CsgD family transcriptional regulator/PAS domain-containing protein
VTGNRPSFGGGGRNWFARGRGARHSRVPVFPIQTIYDAALDDRQFPRLLEAIGAHLGAQSGFLAWGNTATGAHFQAQFGNDPAYLQAYVETYAAHDVLRPILADTPEGEPALAYPWLQTPEIRETRFYREYIAPQGIVDNLAVNLVKREDMFATIALLRLHDAPPFDAEDVARMRELVPHLRRAATLTSYRIHQADLIQAYRQTAHGARDALVLLDGQGRILDLGPEIAALTGLASIDAAARSPFAKALAGTIATEAPVLHMLESGMRLLLVARPVSSNPFGHLSKGAGAAYAVSVTALDRRWGLAYAAIAEAHGLTPGEARVLEDVLTHGDMTDTPTRLGIARATARSHLHRIYAKTGTSGFPDLCLFAHRFLLPRT